VLSAANAAKKTSWFYVLGSVDKTIGVEVHTTCTWVAESEEMRKATKGQRNALRVGVQFSYRESCGRFLFLARMSDFGDLFGQA
jgi:hypothetical protein